MDTDRIAALLSPFVTLSLSISQLKQISTYIDLLLRWNARMNLTAIRQEEEIVTRHFGESLFMARHLFPNPCHPERSQAGSNPPHVLDIGSGAGFPALPLKIWAPQIHLTLIESNHKKTAFLREVSRALTLTNIDVIAERAEVVAARPDFPRANIVTFRAVEHFEAILPQATALTLPKGTLALLIGTAQLPPLTAETRVTWNPPIPVPQSQARVLSIGVLK
jgi:16S rRNA (guanine527-N7)-methyltransferase